MAINAGLSQTSPSSPRFISNTVISHSKGVAGYLTSLWAWMCNEASGQMPGALEYQKHVAVDQVMHWGVSIRKGWK